MTDRIPHILNADMLEDMQNEAVAYGLEALDLYEAERDIAAHIKKEFDKKHHPNWHCIAGRSFGSSVTHETGHFVYFSVGQMCYLLYKCG